MTKRFEHFQSLLLAAILAIGAGMAWGAGLVFTYTILADIFPSLGYSGPSNPYHNLVVASDGTPLIESGDHWHRNYCTLDEKPIPDTQKKPLLKFTILERPLQTNGRFSNLDWAQRIKPFFRIGADALWYFIHDGQLDGRGYLVGYDINAKLTIGYIGRHGFCDVKPSREDQFPVNGHRMAAVHSLFFLCGNSNVREGIQDTQAIQEGTQLSATAVFFPSEIGLVAIDFSERTVRVVWEGTNLGSVNFLNEGSFVGARPPAEWSPHCLMLRTPDQVFLLNYRGKLLQTYSLPETLRNCDLFWYEVSPTEALVREMYDGNEFFWINPSGEIVHKEHVDLHAPDSPHRDARWIKELVGVTFALPCPGLFAAIGIVNPWVYHSVGDSTTYLVAVGKAFKEVWPELVTTGMISVILSVFCYRRQRKFGLPWTWVWTVFVLLFGLPAYFGYLAHRSWPARLACPSCGRRVPRDRPACFACGQDFPAPASKGIEVFA